MTVDWELEIRHDFPELQRTIAALGKVPQRIVTKAANKGARAVEDAVREKAPYGVTGYLQKAIGRMGERNRPKGKKVYEITFDPAYNDVLQKPIARRGIFGGKSEHGYYPASQEYGFKHGYHGGFVPGYHYMQKAAEETNAEAVGLTIKVFAEEVEKEFRKAHG